MGAPTFEAIILAGGLGTRIRSVVPNLPKAMVDVGGHPFLEILLGGLARNHVARVILATGHLHQAISAHFGNRWGSVELQYSVENRPLGTGGAVWKAMEMASRHDVFVLNGDTYFDVSLNELHDFHRSAGADVTLALKPMPSVGRYGTVQLKDGRVAGFREKRKGRKGLINGGVYLLNRHVAERLAFPESFSLETDFLEKKVKEITIAGFVHEGYFIDIGVPEDYARAKRELPRLVGC